MEKIELAMAIAREAHKEDRYGEKDYFEYHLMNVYRRAVKLVEELGVEYGEEVKIVAILHDIHEDHDYEIAEIEKLFGKEVADAVLAISFKKELESRDEYYIRCYADPIARIVKIADASENKYNCELDGKEKRIAYYDKVVKMMMK